MTFLFLVFSFALSTKIHAKPADLSTEVQVNICDSAEQVSSRLNLDAWKSKASEQSHFIENKDLHFYRSDWVFKVKLSPHKNQAEVILKKNSFIKTTARPKLAAALTDHASNHSSGQTVSPLQTSEDGKISCEYDLHGNQKKLACKLTRKISIDEFEHYRQRLDYGGLLNNDQKEWLKTENVKWPDNLEMTTAFDDQDYVHEKAEPKITVGITHNDKAESFIEVSVRSKSDNESSDKDLLDQQLLLDFLNNHGVQLCSDQSSILTRRKLESFFKK